MKTILAIVRPFLLDKILESLRLAPIEAMRINEVQGLGRQKDYLDQYHDDEFQTVFLPKVELSIYVNDDRSQEVIESVLQAARSGRIGDGKIFTVPVEQTIDIATYQSQAVLK